jgi:hypothetical protein
MAVDVAEVTSADWMLNFVLSLAGVSKFVPAIVTDVPGAPIVGEKLLMVGTPLEAVTVKEVALVADPAGDVTLIVPVEAPLGTVAMSWVGVAELTVADVPLKLTVSWLDVALNAVPFIVTDVPTEPARGVNPLIETTLDAFLVIEVKLPTAS